MQNGNATRKKGTEEILKTLTENFPKLMSETKPQVQKAQRIPTRINGRKTTLRHLGI